MEGDYTVNVFNLTRTKRVSTDIESDNVRYVTPNELYVLYLSWCATNYETKDIQLKKYLKENFTLLRIRGKERVYKLEYLNWTNNEIEVDSSSSFHS